MSKCPTWAHCHGNGGGGGWEVIGVLIALGAAGWFVMEYIWWIVGIGVPVLAVAAGWKISRVLSRARQPREENPQIAAYREQFALRARAAAAPPAIEPPGAQHVHLHFDGMRPDEVAEAIRLAAIERR
jgi:hypothetical protein